MGITFLAAGTSVPDCMSSLIVARQGTVAACSGGFVGMGEAVFWFLGMNIMDG